MDFYHVKYYIKSDYKLQFIVLKLHWIVDRLFVVLGFDLYKLMEKELNYSLGSNLIELISKY